MWQKHLYNKNRFSVNKIEILNHYQRIQMASAAWKNRMGFTLVETLLVIVILAALLAGVILAGILAATMSTADSQLWAASSSVSQNLFVRVFSVKVSS